MIYGTKLFHTALTNYTTARALAQNPVLAENPYYAQLMFDRAEALAKQMKQEGIDPAELRTLADPELSSPVEIFYRRPYYYHFKPSVN